MTSTTTSTTTTITTPTEPTLGIAGAWGPHAVGFGEIKPSHIFLDGDPTGDLTNVSWTSWGGAQALGTGTSTYVAPGQTTSQGTIQTATVVGFDLGTCNGTSAYRAVEWYFPQHGDSFNPTVYIKTCTQGYAPGSP